jgi:hypothetical protein
MHVRIWLKFLNLLDWGLKFLLWDKQSSKLFQVKW